MTPAERDALLARARKIQSVGASLLSNSSLLVKGLESVAVDSEPTTPHVAYGWNAGGWWKTGGQTATDAYAQARAAWGTPGVVRLWPNTFGSWADMIPSYVDPGVGLFVNLGSDVAGVNAGRYDADFEAICRTAPADRAVWLSFAHEPEGDGFTVTQWQQAQARLARIKTATGTSARLVALLMGTTYMPSRYAVSAAGNIPAAQWFDYDLTGLDALGADIYQWGKADPGDSAALVVQPCIDLARTLGKGLVVGELGARNLLTDAARARFLDDARALFDANADTVQAVAYFENDNGALGPWNLLPKPGTNPPAPALQLSVAAWRRAVQPSP